ncbi:T9SS type A sorting domain-containing protein [candidate division KSB1 bacterium]|nr:T9SS type A sorting domain-containing protein [candidate division KSB1 bacterium]
MSIKIKTIFMTFFQLIVFCVILSDFTVAHETANYNLKWSITPEGGGFSTSSTYNLFDSFGFPMFGAMSSGSYRISGGSVITKVDRYKNRFGIPENFALKQNYPNPFNPCTKIQFDLPENAIVELHVFNLLGQKIRTLTNKPFEAGYHEIIWDATNNDGVDVSSGTYIFLIRVTANDKIVFQEARKMSLIQ